MLDGWHALCSNGSIIRAIANADATLTAGVGEPHRVGPSNGGSRLGSSGCITRTMPWHGGSASATKASSHVGLFTVEAHIRLPFVRQLRAETRPVRYSAWS